RRAPLRISRDQACAEMTPWPWDPDYPIWQHWCAYPAEDDALMPDTAAAVSAPAPEGQLFKLATRARHEFGPSWRVGKHESPTGCEQIERACTKCPLVKITIIGALEARAY